METLNYKADIQFRLRGTLIKFSVKHNLDDHGLSIENAVDSWITRTPPKEMTPDDFVRYVTSKDPMIKCKLVSPL